LVYSTYLSCIKLSTLCNTSASGCGWSGWLSGPNNLFITT
jgi:hypothetical protein